MRCLGITIATLLTAAAPARAQVDYYAALGITGSTKLIRDVIIQEIDVQPSLAPTLLLGASLVFAPTYRAGLEIGLTSSSFHSSELGVETDLGTLRTGSFMLNLEGPVAKRLNWRAGLGLIDYWPGEQEGIFLQGGQARFLAGAGLDYRPPLLRNWDLLLALRYDFHRFTTDQLKTIGFTGSQGVQRLSLSAGLARARR
jgi:hypothetical protein